MELNRVVFGALGVAGIVAAGGGAYMAGRHNAAERLPASAYASTSEGVVTETENAIAEASTATVAPAQLRPVEATAAPPASRPAVKAPSAARTAPSNRPARTRETAPVTAREMPPSYTPAPVAEPSAPAVGRTITQERLAESTIERAAAAEPPRKLYDELVIPADSVIGLQVEEAVTSEHAKVEDRVQARVTRDVRVRDQVAIPAGSRAEGSITLVETGGRLKDKARLGIRFHTLVLADGTRVPINTETIYREGESPARESAAKIGGAAVGGAVLGAIFGGKRGAVIGSTVGAAGGSVAVATSEPNAATLPAGSTVTVRMGSPATVTVER